MMKIPLFLLLTLLAALLRSASGDKERGKPRVRWSIVDFTPTLEIDPGDGWRRTRGIPDGYRVETWSVRRV